MPSVDELPTTDHSVNIGHLRVSHVGMSVGDVHNSDFQTKTDVTSGQHGAVGRGFGPETHILRSGMVQEDKVRSGTSIPTEGCDIRSIHGRKVGVNIRKPY